MTVSFLLATGLGDAAKAVWPIVGLCVRLGCAMGLYRDSGRSSNPRHDRYLRERLWWESSSYDVL